MKFRVTLVVILGKAGVTVSMFQKFYQANGNAITQKKEWKRERKRYKKERREKSIRNERRPKPTNEVVKHK